MILKLARSFGRVTLCALILQMTASAATRWALDADGGIVWTVKPGEAHQDQIEMSGRKVSLIATYGVDKDAHFYLKRQVVFPLLRTIPNDTHASLMLHFWRGCNPADFNRRTVGGE